MSKKILIIEDETALLKALIMKLETSEFVLTEATNGKDGLGMALRGHPDLILLDIIMPVMDGITMLRELRKDEWGKDAKVILLTNLSDAEKVEEAESQGVHDYLIKSDWRIEDVVKKINEVLQ